MDSSKSTPPAPLTDMVNEARTRRPAGAALPQTTPKVPYQTPQTVLKRPLDTDDNDDNDEDKMPVVETPAEQGVVAPVPSPTAHSPGRCESKVRQKLEGLTFDNYEETCRREAEQAVARPAAGSTTLEAFDSELAEDADFGLAVNNGRFDPFACVYELPRQPGRAFEPVVENGPGTSVLAAGTYWVFHARNSLAQPNEVDRRFCGISRESLSHSEAIQVCRKMCDALDRWPDMDRISKPKGSLGGPRMRTTTSLYNAALASVLPDKPLRLGLTRYEERKDGSKSLRSYVDFFDANLKHHRAKFWQSRVSEDNPVPVVPDTRAVFEKDPALQKPSTGTLLVDLSEVPEAEHAQFRQAKSRQNLVISTWTRTQPVINVAKEVTAFRERKINAYERGQTALQGVEYIAWFSRYRRRDGNVWWNCRTHLRRIVYASRLLYSDQSVAPAHMTIKSPHYGWWLRVNEVKVKTWADTRSVKATQVAMAAEIDRINAQIETEGLLLDICTVDGGCACQHMCGQCGEQVNCSDLAMCIYSAMMSCGRCISKRAGHRANTPFVIRAVARSVLGSAYHDGVRLGAKIPSRVRADLKAWAKDRDFAEIKFHDGATGNTLPFPIHELHSPFRPSVDAVFPLALHDRQPGTYIHTVGNVLVMQLAFNYLKHTHLPMLLTKVAEHYRQYLGLRSLADAGDNDARIGLSCLETRTIRDCRELAAIRRKLPYKGSARMRLDMSHEQLEYFREEWRSGKLHPGTPSPVQLQWIPAPRSADIKAFTGSWIQNRESVRRIVAEIESWTGVKLPRSDDGCPYFGHIATKPKNWSWMQCFRLIVCRWRRMHDWCNGCWVTVDTVITIFLECIFQVCVRKMTILDGDLLVDMKRSRKAKYAEFLGLPLNVEIRDPLNFVVAHRVHGSQMRTGWPADPQHLGDRVDEDNNILIETQTSNYFKMDFDESYYDVMREELAKIQMGREWVDDRVQPRQYDARLEKLVYRSGRPVEVKDDELVEEDVAEFMEYELDEEEENEMLRENGLEEEGPESDDESA
ncbi:uncharacterized protein F5Z01DRAFT_632713 [Emericellopsis atlantica]|uniref:Uncharacterized protein n=1 Tax=Emericellopsis atlantica TaxID=2614577 RepID=A0A9P7ZUK8_9HYPO|nr:uncharacterized protein F5Z01DRAFT_632713 [Emericellopsis atlantica]KAG9258639.1 hypothetical protein F5Z01DRAFT_632713 [Emericellopsis atlantica]